MGVSLDMLYQDSLQCSMIHIFGAALLPSLLKSPKTLDYIDIVASATCRAVEGCRYNWFKTGPEGAFRYLGEMGALMALIRQRMFEEELILWISVGHCSVKEIILLCNRSFHALDLACTAVRSHKRAKTLMEDYKLVVQPIADLAADLLLLSSEVKPQELHARMRAAHQLLKLANSDAVYRLIHKGYGPQWGWQCHGLGCLVTYPSRGQNFSACRGCREAQYCSRWCQKKARSHVDTPHRALCGVFRRITLACYRYKDVRDPASVAAAHRVITTDEAQLALLNIDALVNTKPDALRMSNWCSLIDRS
jgi:hypothetical protein